MRRHVVTDGSIVVAFAMCCERSFNEEMQFFASLKNDEAAASISGVLFRRRRRRFFVARCVLDHQLECTHLCTVLGLISKTRAVLRKL
jgi:hypothetical protein